MSRQKKIKKSKVDKSVSSNQQLLSAIKRNWMLLILIALVFVVYGNSLHNQFVFDDHILIVNTNTLTHWQELGKAFTSNYQPGQSLDNFTNYYRPLVLLSLGIDKLVWGLRPFGFHLTNILLMALLVVLVNVLFLNLFDENKISFLAALLYLVNPIHTEAVSFISGRTDLLATLFMVIALIFYVRWEETGKKTELVFSLAAWLAALGSKESAVVFPIILFSMKILYSYRNERKMWRFEYAYYLGILLLFFLVRYLVLKNNTYWQKDILDVSSIGTVVPKNWKYLKLILWPTSLSTYYTDVFKASLFGWISSLFFLTLPVFLIFISRGKNYKLIAFSSVLFLWGSLPAMGLIRNSSGVEFGERFVFFSSLGISLLLAWAFVKLMGGITSNVWKNVGTILLAAYCSFLGFKTINQNKIWESDYTLFKAMAQTSPKSELAHYNLANEYAKRKQSDSAIVHYRKAIDIMPDNIGAINNLGVLYFTMNQYDMAEAEYQKALLLNPKSSVVYYNVGLCYQQKGFVKEAARWYGMALKKNPYFRPAIDALKKTGENNFNE